MDFSVTRAAFEVRGTLLRFDLKTQALRPPGFSELNRDTVALAKRGEKRSAACLARIAVFVAGLLVAGQSSYAFPLDPPSPCEEHAKVLPTVPLTPGGVYTDCDVMRRPVRLDQNTWAWKTFRKSTADGSWVEAGAPYASAGWETLIHNHQYLGEQVSPFQGPYAIAQHSQKYGPQEQDFSSLLSDWFPFAVPSGTRLGYDLLCPPSPGDFMTTGATLDQTPLALIPPGIGASSTAWNGISRPTVQDTVDLVTGLPLVRVSDLELPFDGAQWRLIRTRSGTRGASFSSELGIFLSGGTDRWWDWTGEGWMASENPFLIIDSTVPEAVSNTQPATTWLVLDAHHSIPFQRLEDNGHYEAPPRFQASMTHNGTWNQELTKWSQPPTQYDVFLYSGQLHYTFIVVREDVPPHAFNNNLTKGPSEEEQWTLSTLHEKPTIIPDSDLAQGSGRYEHNFPLTGSDQMPGVGMPYYGLCVRIEDQQGHEAVIEYAGSRGQSYDDSSTGGCAECGEDVASKGRIKYIKLRSRVNGEYRTRWTLLYIHRKIAEKFNGHMPWLGESSENLPKELVGNLVIDRIYAFENDVPSINPNMEGPGLLDDNYYYNENPVVDPLQSFNPALSSQWKHEVRYHYMPKDADHEDWGPRLPALLVKTSTHSRTSIAGTAAIQNKVFQYSRQDLALPMTSWLEAVFHDQDLARIQQHRKDTDNTDYRDATIDNLARRVMEDHYGLDNVRGEASIVLERHPETSWAPGSFPDTNYPPAQTLLTAGFITQETGTMINDVDYGYGLVGTASIRDESGKKRHYQFNRLMAGTFSFNAVGCSQEGNPFYLCGMGPATSDGGGPMASVFLNPYWYHAYRRSYEDGSGQQNTKASVDLSKPRWITIIDEMQDPSDFGNSYGSSTHADSATKEGQINRQVVECNASGIVLRQRKWEFTSSGVVRSGSGLGEEFVYRSAASGSDPYFGSDQIPVTAPTVVKDELLLVEHRTIGWSAADLAGSGSTDGLVSFRDYKVTGLASHPWESRINLVAEGIKRGTGGQPLYSRQVFYDFDTDHSIETVCDLTHLVATTTPLTTAPVVPSTPGAYKANYTRTWRNGGQTDKPFHERAIQSRQTIGAPKQQRPNGDWYYPVEREFYNETGNSTWAASGLVRSPWSPDNDSSDPLSSLILTHYQRDDQGRSLYTITDAKENDTFSAPDGVSVTCGSYPDVHWPRIAGSSPSLAKFGTIAFKYNQFGLSDIYYPNGRRWARRFVWIQPTGNPDDDFPREYVFNDLKATGPAPDTGPFIAETPGEVNDYGPGKFPSGDPSMRRRVEFGPLTGSGLELTVTSEVPTWTNYWALQMKPDKFGRLQSADLLEPDPSCTAGPGDNCLILVGSKLVSDLTDVLREVEMDHTITRVTRDSTGHPLRTYMGTNDNKWNGPPEDDVSDNMYLTSRTTYGASSKDAWLPTRTWRYRTNPTWADHDFFSNIPDSDTNGMLTETGYDWRMRPVRVDSYSGAQPTPTTDRLSTTVTYLDHSDRPVLTATFGAGAALPLPGGLDPTDLVDAQAPPTPRQLFDLVPRPLSIVESVYGPDGSMIERRTYDVGWTPTGGATANPPYLAEKHYFGRGGVEVFTQRPGQAITITTIDPLGRIASTSQIVPPTGSTEYAFEISRTDNGYDRSGNVAESTRWDRVGSTGGNSLNAGNAVRTKSVTWHDAQKRVVASAELGTQDASGTYVSNSSDVYSVFLDSDHNLKPAPIIVVNGSTASIQNDSGLPSIARFMINSYDRYGNRVLSAEPNGAITKYDFSRTGRLLTKTENAFAPSAEYKLRRSTRYEYALGRLVAMKAVVNPTQNGPEALQTTTIRYEAKIVNETGVEVSQNNGFVGDMFLPQEGSNGASTESHINLKYNFQGQVVERIDARGVVMRYTYDTLDRLSTVTIGHYISAGTFQPGYPDSMTPPTGATADRIGFVQYTYGYDGNLSEIIAKESAAATIPITYNKLDRDARQNLTTEWQAFGTATVTSGIPHTSYNWLYRPTGTGIADVGVNRPLSVTYPAQLLANASARTVSLGYGSAGSAEDMLSRITQTTTTVGTGSAVTAAEFSYTGIGLRRELKLGAAKVTQSYKLADEIGLSGLSSFGEIADLHYKSTATSNETLARASYTYDTSGNRRSAEVTQMAAGSGSGQTGANKRSQVNTYDKLNRLKETDVGTLAFVDGQPTIQGSAVRKDVWNLDQLGNWSNVGSAAQDTGRYSVGNLDSFGTAFSTPTADSADDTSSLLFATNKRNAIISSTSSLDGGSPAFVSMSYDKNGNLRFDGQYFYQYDAWSRLVQVNRATPITPVPGPGDPIDYVIGVMVKHFTYDGFGRLVRTQSPFPDPDTANGLVRSERYYYDGIRRIQELVTDPIANSGLALNSGPGELNQILNETTGSAAAANGDTESAPIAFEQGQLNAAAAPGGGTTGSVSVYVNREYIWGPGDHGIDELLIQYDRFRKPWYVLQDAGGDIVALAEVPGTNGSGTARVVAQWTYDPYGSVLFAEHLYAHPYLHAGHKAAFVERLDAGVAAANGTELPRVIPFAQNIYHMRNRVYAPGLGRFLQPDPNATATALLDASAYHGRGVGAMIAAFDIEGLYGNGMNLYEYLGSNPINRNDPSGLSWDPFDMVDDYLAEDAGQKAAFLGALGQSAKAIAVVTAQIASYLPFPGLSTAGDLALVALGEQSATDFAVGAAIGLIPGGKLLGKVGGFLGKLGGSAWRLAKEYASKGVSFLWKESGGLIKRAATWLVHACGCFESGTEVWTASGLVPIEEVQVNDLVLAFDDKTGETDFRQVKRTFVRKAAPILAVALSLPSGESMALNTTEEHPFRTAASQQWVPAGELQPGELVETADGVASIQSLEYTDRASTVYNFEVEGLHNYYVSNNSILVHNVACPIHKHHWIPQVKDIKSFASRVGINIDDFIQPITDKFHWFIHGNHRRPQDLIPRWREFINTNQNATKSEIEAFAASEKAHFEQLWSQQVSH